jgi:hypothetical protein
MMMIIIMIMIMIIIIIIIMIIIIIRLLRISTWCRNCVNCFSTTMNSEIKIDKSFPYFDEHNFSGWLMQFKAMLPELDCDVIETPSVGVLVSFNSHCATTTFTLLLH